MEQPRTHGMREFHRNATDVDYAVEQIRTIGYAIVPSGLSPEDLASLRIKMDAIYERQVQEIGGEATLEQINDRHLARCIIGYDDIFLTLATHPTLIAICRALLGPAVSLMSQNGIFNQPGGHHYQTTWHRDLNYQHWVSSRPLALSALYVIDDFSPETGGTYLLPASHKIEAFPSVEYVEQHHVTISAKAGAILVFDSMVFHRTGTNHSKNVRRAVNHIYTPPLIKQQISMPHVLGGRFSDDPFLRQFLGYDSQTADSALDWRTRKLAIRAAQPAQKT